MNDPEIAASSPTTVRIVAVITVAVGLVGDRIIARAAPTNNHPIGALGFGLLFICFMAALLIVILAKNDARLRVFLGAILILYSGYWLSKVISFVCCSQ